MNTGLCKKIILTFTIYLIILYKAVAKPTDFVTAKFEKVEQNNLYLHTHKTVRPIDSSTERIF